MNNEIIELSEEIEEDMKKISKRYELFKEFYIDDLVKKTSKLKNMVHEVFK